MSSNNKNLQVYLTGGFAAIGGLLFGYDTGVISGVLTMSDFLLEFGGPAAVTRGSLPSSISGSIVGVMLVGCFVGALLAGPSGDRYSRKYSIVLFSVVFIVSAILQTGSFNLFMLLLSRVVAGRIYKKNDDAKKKKNHNYFRHIGGCIVYACTCLSIRNSYKKNSWTTCITSTMGYYYWYCN